MSQKQAVNTPTPGPYAAKGPKAEQMSYFSRLGRDLYVNRELYILFIPVIVFYVIFHYAPMYGAIIAFKDYRPAVGMFASSWVGFKHFQAFFSSYYFWVLLRNTLVLSFSNLLFGFPAPILLALLLNELKSKRFARTVQTITYMPHFVSLVVVCGMIIQFTKSNGFITYLLTKFGYPQQTLLSNANAFAPIYVISSIWQEIGWGSIIYLAALSGIDQELYEAAEIDGSNFGQSVRYITIPSIKMVIELNLFLSLNGALQAFNQAYLITKGGPGDRTKTFALNTYYTAFDFHDFGIASALGVFLLALITVVMLVQNLVLKSGGDLE